MSKNDKESPVVEQKCAVATVESFSDGWRWSLVRATGWDSSRKTGPGIGQGLAQPPTAASTTEWHSSHTHLDTAHCLTAAGHLDRHTHDTALHDSRTSSALFTLTG